VGDPLQGFLHVQGGQEPAGVGQEDRGAQDPLPVGHVPVAPDPPDDPVADPLRPGVELEVTPVAEVEGVEALRVGVGVDLADAAQDALGVVELVADHIEQAEQVLPLELLGRDPPHVQEPPVVGGHLPRRVGDQQPVGGRLQGGAEERDQLLARLPGVPQVGRVPADAAHPLHLAVPVGQHVAPGVEHPDRAVRADDPVVVGERMDVAERLEDDGAGPLAVLREDTIEEGLVGAGEVAGVEAVDPVELVAPAHHVSLHVPFPVAEVSDPLRLGEDPLVAHTPPSGGMRTMQRKPT
jgi:hypothetical protein